MSHNIKLHKVQICPDIDTPTAKTANHEPGSLPDLVQNLVKNWEIEASFKQDLSQWRTINPDEYSFSINGRPPLSGADMVRLGTYNAIIQPGNEFYSPENSDFSQSHKTFKRMMPTFAWEVLDVIGGPPVVGIKWRHWGVMKDDYVGFNDKGEKVTAKAHGGSIELKGTTWAWVDDQVRVKKLETWFDPVEMFRQIAPNGIINKETVQPEAQGIKVESTPSQAVNGESALSVPAEDTHDPAAALANGTQNRDESMNDVMHDGEIEAKEGSRKASVAADADEDPSAKRVNQQSTPPRVKEQRDLDEGSAIALPAEDTRTQEAYAEMNKVTPMQCPFMNKE